MMQWNIITVHLINHHHDHQAQADAVHLGSELPLSKPLDSTAPRVLYPCSSRARSTLEDLLQRRGFDVLRFDTYGTECVEALALEQKQLVTGAGLLVFASPSAVRYERNPTMVVTCTRLLTLPRQAAFDCS